jgi:PAS domain S-box-containing protein
MSAIKRMNQASDCKAQKNSPTVELLDQPNNKQNLRLLHVDDDRDFLEVSKQILLTNNNFEIDSTTTIEKAIQKIKEQTYDAIISDYELPLKNGLDFLKELRENHNEVPFILFTGKGREAVAVKALNLGADCYIDKNGSLETVYCELADAIKKTVERKKSRQQYVASESNYRALVENSLQGILLTKMAPLKIIFANNAMGQLLGYPPEELTSLSPQEIQRLVHAADREAFFKRVDRRVKGQESPACFEFRAIRKDGSTIWLSGLSNTVEYNGQSTLLGMFLDITEKKKNEENQIENEQRYRELADSLPGIVFETDLSGQIVFANKMAREIGGYSAAELERGLHFLQVLSSEGQDRAMRDFEHLLSGGEPIIVEFTFVQKNGGTFPSLITVAPIFHQNKVTGVRGLVLDITERKKAEEALKKSEIRYRQLANSLPEIVFETDLQGTITFFNERALEITGFTQKELEKGLNILSFVVEKDRERATKNMKRSLNGEHLGSNEYMLSKKDGATFSVLLSTSPIMVENKATGLRGLVVDIAERQKAEIALSQAMDKLVFINEKLTVVGGLTRHDIRNKLTVLAGNVFLLRKKYADQHEIMHSLDAMEQACKSTMKILDFAKMYEELGAEELTFIDVQKTLEEAVVLFSLPSHVKVINDCQGLNVLADSFLRQLFYNLIDNSIKHGENVKEIRVQYEKTAQGSINLIYTDDGVGISLQNKLNLFKEGFSTCGSTGYGLSLIKKTMAVYGWEIQENGAHGKGAKFTITIPEFNRNGEKNIHLLG